MPSKTITYKNESLTVYWKPDVCIHSANCVKGLPAVFDVNKKPWVTIDGAAAKEIMAVIDTCPSAALSYEENRPKTTDENPPVEMRVMENGPMLISGEVCVKDATGKVLKTASKMALCRCGSSENKPFCDGAHKNAGFVG